MVPPRCFLISIFSVLVVLVVPFEHREMDSSTFSPSSSSRRLSPILPVFFLRRLRENDDVFELSRFAAPRKNCCCYSAPPRPLYRYYDSRARERERERRLFERELRGAFSQIREIVSRERR